MKYMSVDNPKNKAVSLFLLFLVLVLGAVFTYIASTLEGNKSILTNNENLVIEPRPETSESEGIANDPMKDWKTYTNEKYGFMFRYPTSYQIYNSTSLGPVYMNIDLNSPDVDISIKFGIYDMGKTNDLRGWIIDHGPAGQSGDIFFPSVVSLKSNLRNDLKTEEFFDSIPGVGNTKVITIVFSNNNKAYIWRLISPTTKESSQVLDQILSTFEFDNLNSSQQDSSIKTSIRTIKHSVISSWATYNSEFIGLTFQYPTGFRQIEEVKDDMSCNISFSNDSGGVILVKIVPYSGESRRKLYEELYGMDDSTFNFAFDEVYIQGSKSLIIEASPLFSDVDMAIHSGSGSAVVIPNGERALIISLSNRYMSDEWFQNILKSIKFTKLSDACG